MKRFLLLLSLSILSIIAFSQTSSKGFSFQGYAIDPEGKAISQQSITVKFTVYPKGGTGVTYTEEQELTSDNYGVFHAEVGAENPASFQKMDFTGSVDYWLKVQVKKTVGGAYTTINDAEMLAVPYARQAANGVPVGTVITFAGPSSKIPDGWLICDGSQLDGSSADYAQLYNILGNTWGGSGTNFRLPDLRGQFLRGVDGGAGTDPDAASRTSKNGSNSGDDVGSYQTDETKSHNHGVTDPGHNHGVTDPGHTHGIRSSSSDSNGGNNDYGNNHSRTNYTQSSTTGISINNATTGVSVNNTGGAETRPTNAAVYYIIKY